MKMFRLLAVCAAGALMSGGVSAQTVGIGTTKGGATAQVAAAIAKVVSSKSPIQMRTQTMGGTQQYIPVVNAGELEFGIANIIQTHMARTGTGLSKGKKYDKLYMVATLMKFRVSALVPVKAGFKTLKDLKGSRYPVSFKASPLIGLILESFLVNGGMSVKDVKAVPAVALRQHWNMMEQGKIDAATAVVGSGIIKKLNSTIGGGVKFLSLDNSPAAEGRLKKMLPGVYLTEVKPNAKFVAVKEPVNVLTYDYMLWTHKGMNEKHVYEVTKALYNNEQALRDTGPLWGTHASKTMSKRQGNHPHHPGAIKFYKEIGAWKG